MRKLHAEGARAISVAGLFTKAAELGAFTGRSPSEMGVFKALAVKAGLNGRAETCRDSLAAQAGCSVRTVTRALAVWRQLGFCRVVKTLTGVVVLIDVSCLRRYAAAVDLAKARGREMVWTFKEMRAAVVEAFEKVRKGHDGQSSGHDVPRPSGILLRKEEDASASSSDPVQSYLRNIAERKRTGDYRK